MVAGQFNAIRSSPSLLAEAERALPALRRDATRPATAPEIMAILSQRFALYPQPDRSDGEWAAWWSDYTNALDDIPPAAIEAGMAHYVKAPDAEFFPKPGRIRELARTAPNKIALACATLQRALQEVPADGPQMAPEPPMTDAERAKVREMVKGYNDTMSARTVAVKPVLPPISGPVDGAGVTQLMRERMDRQ